MMIYNDLIVSYYYIFMVQLISRKFNVKGLLAYKSRIELFLAQLNGSILCVIVNYLFYFFLFYCRCTCVLYSDSSLPKLT